MNELTAVKLPFVNETELTRLGATVGEAQPIGVRLPSATSLYINTRLIQDAGVDKTNMLITNRRNQASGYAGTLIEGATKITATRFSPYMVSPNVNPNNGVLRLIYDAAGAFVDVQVEIGWYLSPLTLMQGVVDALNTATGTTGITFTSPPTMSDSSPGSFPTIPIGSPQIYSEIQGSGPFAFSPDSFGFQNGKSLWNAPAVPVGTTAPFPLATSAIFGPIGLIYTRTLDVCSRELTRYAKRYNTTINPSVPPSLLFRVTLGPGTIISPNPYGIPIGEVNTSGFGDALQLDAFSFDSSQVVSAIDVKVLDQYGLPLYVPPPPPTGPPQGGFDYSLHIFVQ